MWKSLLPIRTSKGSRSSCKQSTSDVSMPSASTSSTAFSICVWKVGGDDVRQSLERSWIIQPVHWNKRRVMQLRQIPRVTWIGPLQPFPTPHGTLSNSFFHAALPIHMNIATQKNKVSLNTKYAITIHYHHMCASSTASGTLKPNA